MDIPVESHHPERGHAGHPMRDGGLRRALLDSRQRMEHLVGMAADLAFETDGDGNLVFASPDTVLGWPAQDLLGQPAECLLADPVDRAAFNPFRPHVPVRGRRAWMRREDGSVACLEFTSTPLLDATGQVIGVRGVGVDRAAQDAKEAGICAALRRGEIVDRILWHMRQEVYAPRMMQSVLDSVLRALGAQGCAVLDLLQPGAAAVLHRAGPGAPEVVEAALALLRSESDQPRFGRTPGGEGLLACPASTRFGERAGLALWRAAGAPPWDGEDRLLISSVTAVIRIVLEHDAIQRELARQARTDALTGLVNRRAFLEELTRRIDRLDREELPGTLLFIDLDSFRLVNDRFGHEAGDEALLRTAAMLRDTVRPSDLVARLGGDKFALWLDGADELTAAERAERLRVDAPGQLASALPDLGMSLTLSIGIACRHPRGAEEMEDVMRRAELALHEVKRTGRGHWRVCHGDIVT